MRRVASKFISHSFHYDCMEKLRGNIICRRFVQLRNRIYTTLGIVLNWKSYEANVNSTQHRGTLEKARRLNLYKIKSFYIYLRATLLCIRRRVIRRTDFYVSLCRQSSRRPKYEFFILTRGSIFLRFWSE